MSEVKTNYVPLNQAESEQLRIILPIPSFVDQSQILVGVTPMHRLFRIAGISHLRIQAADSDETSNFQPTVVGLDSEGGAYAAKTGLKTIVPTYSFETGNEDNRLWHTRQVSGTVDINIDEMAKRIAEEKRWPQGVRSPEPWAYHLNKALKGSIQSIGLRHLLLDFNGTDLFAMTWIYGTQLGIEVLFGAEQVVPGLFGYGVIMNFFNKAFYRDSRTSLIYGPQLDRAAIFAAHLATRPLVKVAQK